MRRKLLATHTLLGVKGGPNTFTSHFCHLRIMDFDDLIKGQYSVGGKTLLEPIEHHHLFLNITDWLSMDFLHAPNMIMRKGNQTIRIVGDWKLSENRCFPRKEKKRRV